MAVAVHVMRRVKSVQENQIVVYGLGTVGLLLVMLLIEKGIKNIFVIGNKDFHKQSVIKLGIPESNYCDSRIQNVEDWILSNTKGHGAVMVFECIGKNETIAQAICLVAPGDLISHRYPMKELERGFHITRNKSEDCIKAMII